VTYSKISRFETCPLKYFFHVQKFSTKAVKSTAVPSKIGEISHELIQKLSIIKKIEKDPDVDIKMKVLKNEFDLRKTEVIEIYKVMHPKVTQKSIESVKDDLDKKYFWKYRKKYS